MSTSKSAWQRRERNGAALFGAKRQRCSGSSGREDETRSDSTHPRLFIESKLRASSAVRTLWDETDALARKEGKTPVVLAFTKHKHGCLIVVHERDLDKVIAERLRVYAKDHDLAAFRGILAAADLADLLEASEILDGKADA